jgi:hypothetical protein
MMAKIMDPGAQASEVDLLFSFFGAIGSGIGALISPWVLMIHLGWGVLLIPLSFYCSYRFIMKVGPWLGRKAWGIK